MYSITLTKNHTMKKPILFGLFLLITTFSSCSDEFNNKNFEGKEFILEYNTLKINRLEEGSVFYIEDIKIIHSKKIDSIVSENEILLPSYEYEIKILGPKSKRNIVKTNRVQLAKYLAKGLHKKGLKLKNLKLIDAEGKVTIESDRELKIKIPAKYPLILSEK